MMSSGVLYSQPIVPECSANDGPVYLVNEIEVSHEQVDVRGSTVCSYIILHVTVLLPYMFLGLPQVALILFTFQLPV